MTWSEFHPALNAGLNATAAVCLALGYRAIRAGQRERHGRLMGAAFTTSVLFLVSYVLRFLSTGTHRYPSAGFDKYVYLIVLFSHMVLAVVVVPLILRALWFARQQDFAAHRKVVRWAWPMWMYVSVTGVVVYLMLYHLGPALA